MVNFSCYDSPLWDSLISKQSWEDSSLSSSMLHERFVVFSQTALLDFLLLLIEKKESWQSSLKFFILLWIWSQKSVLKTNWFVITITNMKAFRSHHCVICLFKGNTVPPALLGSDSQWLREAEVYNSLQNHHIPTQLPGPAGIFGGEDCLFTQICIYLYKVGEFINQINKVWGSLN